MSIRRGNLVIAAKGIVRGDLFKTFVVDDTVATDFNSTNDEMTITSSFVDLSGNTITLEQLSLGDNIIVKQLDVPDRYVMTKSGSSVKLGKLETTKVTIPTSINGFSGGSLTSPLVIHGGNGTNAAKIALDNTRSGQLTDGSTKTIFGFLTNNTTTLTVGSTDYALNLRGSGNRPTYKDADLALYSDIPATTNSVTQNSTAALTSGGAYTALSKISNSNLLINGDFRINQRGQTTYSTGGKYSVDRWMLRDSCVVTKQTNGIMLTSAGSTLNGIFQSIENFENLLGKTVTLSIKLSNVNTASSSYMQFGICNSSSTNSIGTPLGFYAPYYPSTNIVSLTVQIPSTLENDHLNVYLVYVGGHSVSTDSVTVEYIKLEIGDTATQLSPKPYAQELADCQRYYQIIKSSNQYAIYCETWFNGGTANCDGFIHIPVTMRTTPTMTINGSLKIISKAGGSYTYTSAAVHTLYDNQILVRFVTSGGTQGQECMIQANNDTTTSIEFDSEI